jgi:DNA-binding transcriptional ArsR family regulator
VFEFDVVADGVDAALRALADPNRRRILALVRDQPRAVGDIASAVSMSQQAVSHHLHVLRGAGLVTERHERTRHLFVVRTDGLRLVRDFLDGFWPSHLAALKLAAEAEAKRTSNVQTAPITVAVPDSAHG